MQGECTISGERRTGARSEEDCCLDLKKACGKRFESMLGEPTILDVVKKGVRHIVHVFEVWREDLPAVLKIGDGAGPNPLQNVRWCSIADVVGHANTSYILNWTCSKLVRKMLISKRSPLPIVQPSRSGQYNVLAMNYGLNTDGQSSEGSQLRVIGGTESNPELVKHFVHRGFEHLGTSGQLLRDLKAKRVQLKDVHVLSARCGHQSRLLQPGKQAVEQQLSVTTQVDQVLGVAEITLPSVVFIRLPPPDPAEKEFDMYIGLESKLVKMGCEVPLHGYYAIRCGGSYKVRWAV